MGSQVLSALTWAWLAAAPVEVTVLAAGDVTPGYHYQEHVDALVERGVPEAEAVGWGFAKVGARTRQADLFVVNLECPFTARGQKVPKNFNFRARPELAALLGAGGVDVVSLANNHLMDFGPQGLEDTVAAVEARGVAHFGAGRTLAEARRPAVVTVKGVRVAFLGYFFLGDRNLEPKELIATEKTPGVAGDYSDLAVMAAMVTADVRAAKQQAQHVIPFFHWGRETHAEPEPYQVALAHAAIDAGASAVLGSHPHVLQGLEVYRGAPIAYSLGNFVFGGNWDPQDKRTALLELTLSPTAVTGARVVPAFSDAYPEAPVQPFLAQGDEADAIRAALCERSAAFPATLPSLRCPPRGAPDAGAARELDPR